MIKQRDALNLQTNAELAQSELDLLRSVGYELKTPLSHIRNTSLMLAKSQYAKTEIAEQHQRIYITAERLLGLVDSLLFAGRIQSNQTELLLEPVNVAATVNRVVKDLKPLASRYGRHVHLKTSPSLKPIMGHEQALKYAIGGVVDSLIRSSHSEVVDILVHHQQGSLMVSIRDDGEKITQATLDHIISNIGQSAQPSSQISGASGITIYLAHVLTEAMNGSFYAQNSSNRRILSFVFPLSAQLSFAI